MQKAPDRESEGFFAGLVQKYDSIWQTFILPERASYHTESLGPELRRLDRDQVFRRVDFGCLNLRGEKLASSFFGLQNGEQATAPRSDCCLVYLHSHGGNRLEGLSLLRHAASLDMNLCTFDFAGSGLSEGKYTTLGLRESEDCRVIIEYLMRNLGQKRFVLWGRSMGAVAAILYASGKQPHIKSMVLDSPFSDVEQMVRDAGNSYISLGEYLALFLFSMVKNDIKQHIGQDLSTFQPIKFCSLCEVPCLFLVGKSDPLVPPERVKEMFEAYKGKLKDIAVIEGSHSSGRSLLDVEKAFVKIASHLKTEAKPFSNDASESTESSIRYGTAMIDKFGELDSIMGQKRMEKKLATKENGDFQMDEKESMDPRGARQPFIRPTNQIQTARPSKGPNHSRILPITEIPFSVAPPRFIDHHKASFYGKVEAPLLRTNSRIDTLRNQTVKPEPISPFKTLGYNQNSYKFSDKENYYAGELQGHPRNKFVIEPRKSTTYLASSQNQPSPTGHHQQRPQVHSERSGSRNLIFSKSIQEQNSVGFQYKLNSPILQTEPHLKEMTQISPFQVSRIEGKDRSPMVASKISRPASPYSTDKQHTVHNSRQNFSQISNQYTVPQEANLMSQYLQTGQLKAALQSKLKERPVTPALYENFTSFHSVAFGGAKLNRGDSVHRLVPDPTTSASKNSTAMMDPFSRNRKSIRQMKIFDDIDDSPFKDNSLNLANHTINLYPGKEREQKPPMMKPLAFAQHTSSFR
jgi:pimeloyl-ACP methyl ester carboxylesterase